MMQGEEYFPKELTEENLHFIGSRILSNVTGEQHALTMACFAEKDGSVPRILFDTASLKLQLNQAVRWPGSIQEDIHVPPSAFVAATEQSVPLLDVVRGMHDAYDLAQPLYAVSTEPDMLARMQRQPHVSIITHHAEQTKEYVARAAKLLYWVGVEQVSVLRTRVYERVDPSDLDLAGRTSEYKDFMQKIGSMCVWND